PPDQDGAARLSSRECDSTKGSIVLIAPHINPKMRIRLGSAPPARSHSASAVSSSIGIPPPESSVALADSAPNRCKSKSQRGIGQDRRSAGGDRHGASPPSLTLHPIRARVILKIGAGQPLDDDIGGLDLDAQPPAVLPLADGEGGAAAAERVEHDLA